MNRFFVFLLMPVFFAVTPSTGQHNSSVTLNKTRYTAEIAESASNITGGKFITSVGMIRCLVVFVEFANEATDNAYWPGRQAPVFMYKFIDPDTNTKSKDYINLTYFFDQMSLGKLKLVGDPFHTILPYTEFMAKIYGYTRPQIIRDALQQLDNQIDFNQYDNWGSSGAYSHYNSGDGVVDMIFVVFRSIEFLEWNFNGEASLGYGESYEFDGVRINHVRLSTAGSGTTCLYKCRSPEVLTTIARHEFAHYLLGEEHPFSDRYDDRHKIWSLLSDGRMANAYERERLGWISVEEIFADRQTINMPDFITTGIAFKFHPPNGEPNEYYYFENHQKIHLFDDESLNKEDRGVYVLHFLDDYNDENNVRCLTANGSFQWETPYSVPYPPNPSILLPAFMPIRSDVNGRNHRDALQVLSGGREYVRAIVTSDSAYSLGEFFRGLGMTETFSCGGNNVFSPWSNPAASTWAGEPVQFAMEITGSEAEAVQVSFNITQPSQAPPSVPKNFHTFSSSDQSVLLLGLGWDKNSEPDLSGYSIERSVDGADWEEFEIINPDSGVLVDSSMRICEYGTGVPVRYRLRSVDSIGMFSNYSKICSVMCIQTEKDEVALDIAENPDRSAPDHPFISQNFPNPFNAETSFRLFTQENGHVELEIFDMNGRIVTTLFKGYMARGEHHLRWNGQNDSGLNAGSGIYLYRFRAGNRSVTKRMILVR